MNAARVRVVAAGPLVSFQDAGRPGHMRFGVPSSGPMDRVAHAAANIAVGNEPSATAIEISLGGLAIEIAGDPVTVAVTGGSFEVRQGADRRSPWSVFTLRPGERWSIGPGDHGSWAYLAVAGTIDAATWLGHTATHSMSGFGGGSLVAGQDIEIDGARHEPERDGRIPRPDVTRPTGRARVVMGPQDHHFDDAAITTFRSTPYALTPAADRMGVRLAGAPLVLRAALSIPSEPIVRGSIQVTGDGVPTLLLADHQTTGGYPKIATVVDADLDRLAQMRAPEEIRFVPVEPREAIEIARRHARRVRDELDAVSGAQRALARTLMTENLIGDGTPD